MNNVVTPIILADIPEAEHLVGKVLRHVRHSGDECGFVFCFADEDDENQGPMALLRLEVQEDRVELRLHCSGEWYDKEEQISA